MFEDDAYNSMDFEPGHTYLVYLSYFLGRPDSTDAASSSRIFGGEIDEQGKPIFQKIFINRL